MFIKPLALPNIFMPRPIVTFLAWCQAHASTASRLCEPCKVWGLGWWRFGTFKAWSQLVWNRQITLGAVATVVFGVISHVLQPWACHPLCFISALSNSSTPVFENNINIFYIYSAWCMPWSSVHIKKSGHIRDMLHPQTITVYIMTDRCGCQWNKHSRLYPKILQPICLYIQKETYCPRNTLCHDAASAWDILQAAGGLEDTKSVRARLP